MAVEIGVLGPIAVTVDGRPAALGGPLQRALLAALALRCPNPVSRTELIAMLWGEHPPASAKGNLQSYVASLRRVLEPRQARNQPFTILLTERAGYRLQLSADAVDAHRFTARADAGACFYAEGRHEEAAAEFTAALDCWRGTAFDDVTSPFARYQREWYAERGLDVLESWSAAKLRLGEHEEVVARLRRPVAEHPLRERLTAALIEALTACGHTAEARELGGRSEALLTDTLGDGVAAARERGQDPVPVAKPAQLPHGISPFVGRAAELTALHRLSRADSAPRVVVLHGEGASGKTALATRFGARVASRFPDGQLYLDLRGAGPGRRPMRSEDALASLLGALGVPAEDLPTGLDGRSGLLRTLLADARVLLVLDNAATAAQVRPLLPGSDGCFVVVTSRNRLRGLSVTDGAAAVSVGVFDEREAVGLLGAIAGEHRVEREPEAARVLVRACGLLALSVRIAAERAAMRPRHTLAELADELSVEARRLDLLSAQDDHYTIRAVFSWSYDALPPDAVRMFRVLGVFPGESLSIEAIATLAGIEVGAARRAVRALIGSHLLQEHLPGRYRVHGLLRIYALERFESEESAAERARAVQRLLDWYLQGVILADGLLPLGRIPAGPPSFSVPPPELRDHDSAVRWCEAESANFVQVILLAKEFGFPVHAGRIAHFLIPLFPLRGRRWERGGVVAERRGTTGRRREALAAST
ncbi:AfsR/SARP family transcriptional regulator [Amycolatopsis sp. CA-230715]|uniref:AfsR/SARP family transcriptional regulator n=1 Tax=Amycolatopsis sp. CA-230715 TaxID=2745196 RepID=UPI001C009D4F|nr:BTAD domain-containing putative transcriptional regulator [Amycolatopsis sp. CA-230715]QWF82736.1 Regulatory protein AfsR [Amycolatopsis sp. CA-230715]